jgi:uncharacterized cupredoxin-like copper-binding protein
MTRIVTRGLLVVLAVLLLAGCAVNQPRMLRMMRGGMPGHSPARVLCTSPPDVSGRRVDVLLMDGGPMMGPTLRAWPVRVHAGPVTFVATNHGRRTHELVVLPLSTRTPAGWRRVIDGQVVERRSLGEASASCAPGQGDGIRPGRSGWVTLDLRPGRYELVCNERNHYAAGMYEAFVVLP